MIREELFSCEAALFLVFRRDDGSTSWSDYEGKKVQVALPLAGGARCVILLVYNGREKGAFKNLFCIERDGTVAWTAELPEPIDVFVDAELHADELIAHTFSCYMITMSPETGQVIRQVFTK
jgi:hypothetical protein